MHKSDVLPQCEVVNCRDLSVRIGRSSRLPQFIESEAGGNQTSSSIVYTRRWSITPLPTNPNNTLVIQVLVTRNKDRGQADQGDVARLPEEARMIAVRTRKAQ